MRSSGPCAPSSTGPNPSRIGGRPYLRNRSSTAGIEPPDETAAAGWPNANLHAWSTLSLTSEICLITMPFAATTQVSSMLTWGCLLPRMVPAIMRKTSAAGTPGGSRTSSVAFAVAGIAPAVEPASKEVTVNAPHVVERSANRSRCNARPAAPARTSASVGPGGRPAHLMPHVNGAYRGDFSIERWCQPFWRSGCVHGGCDNRSALITVISSYPTLSSYPMWRDFAMSVNVAGTVSSSLGNEQERRSDEHDGGGEAMDAHGD